MAQTLPHNPLPQGQPNSRLGAGPVSANARAGSVPARVAGDPRGLANLIYRSEATQNFDSGRFDQIMDVAVARNAREGLTGTLVYDQGRFMQWLEGPQEALDRVLGSIRVDSRHTGLEVLRARPIRERAFSDWRMRLAVRRSQPFRLPPGTFEASDAPIDALMTYPEAAPSLLRVLFGAEADNDDRAILVDITPQETHLRACVERFVAGLGFSAAFGDIRSARTPSGNTRELLACARELARLFSAARDEAETAQVEAICRTAGAGLDDFVRLYGRTAAALGDLWQADVCTGADISVALSELQLVYTRMRRHGVIDPDRGVGAYRVTVAQMPGDLHIVGAILQADVLRSRGWTAMSRFPSSGQELVHEVTRDRLDCVVVATSSVSPDDEGFERVRALVTALRAASLNPDLAIVVAGRAFTDNPGSFREVGADAGADTPLALPAILRGLLVS
jgi:methylmalonyl-CoA mutase cobalamin-binding subunit